MDSLNVLGVGVSELKESLERDGFENTIISETISPQTARELLSKGETDLLIYNVSKEDKIGIDEVIKRYGEKGKRLYVAKTLGWTPKLNRGEVYDFLGKR